MSVGRRVAWAVADDDVVHAEPGQDKITFANDVADWILARAGAAVEPASTRSPAKSRL